MNRRRDMLTGAVLLLLAVGYWIIAAGFRRTILSDSVGAGGFPKLLAALLALLSVALIIQAALRPKPGNEEREKRREEWLRDTRRFVRAGGLLVLGLIYLIIVPWTGYVPGIGLLLLATLLYQRERLGARTVIFSAAGAGFFWLFFVWAMNIPMPEGIWPALLKWLR